MEPFAYEKPKQPDRRKLILMGLAAASFSIWYFDLVPELATVSTGNIEPDSGEADLTTDDFIAMLESTPASDEILDENPFSESMSTRDEDRLLTSATDTTEPIEAVFPEFATAGDSDDGDSAAETDPISDFDPPAPPPADSQQAPSTGIQQVAFNSSAPSFDSLTMSDTVLSAEIADHLNDVDQWVEAGETLEAHAALSRLYWKHPDVRSHIQDRLNRTAAEIYANPSRHFAEPYLVQFGDTLEGIAKNYNVPWQYLGRLNRVTPKTLQAGHQLKVLKGPFGAVVNLKDRQLTMHAHGWYVRSYRIGIGKDHSTPAGEFTVKEKLENPTWYNPAGGVVDADDPSNPLGEYWIGLGNHIGIHGTIDPNSIGASVSQGCIHLADDDIAEVFQLLGEGSEVVIR